MIPNFEPIKIENLEFDKQNPRLPTSVQHSHENDIIRYLVKNTGLEDLMTSIGENGFFPGEAIVVVKAVQTDKYIVLEGNRRLAALRLLQDPSIAAGTGRIVRAAQQARCKPDVVPAYIVGARSDAMQYLGFRHITGIQRWDPLAKARYLKQLFDEKIGEPQEKYLAVAREIGSRSNAVRRNLDALAAYNVVEQEDFFGIDDLSEDNFQFGVFYTAIGNGDVANFIGVKQDGQDMHPVQCQDVLNKDHLKELTEWMFKEETQGRSRGKTTRLGDSRNIADLGTVLSHDQGLHQLRQGSSLANALKATVDTRAEFIRHMTLATDELKESNANLHSVDSSDAAAVTLTREALRAIEVAARHLEVK